MNDKSGKFTTVWIIGYGNTQRRDDGIGPYIADQLFLELGHQPGFHIRSLHQLDPVLIDDKVPPDFIIFVDSTHTRLEQGWRFQDLQPDLRQWPFAMHHLPPPIFLGLLGMCLGCNPTAWIVTVQGDDFEFGTGLTPASKTRADKAAMAIGEFARSRFFNRCSQQTADYRLP